MAFRGSVETAALWVVTSMYTASSDVERLYTDQDDAQAVANRENEAIGADNSMRIYRYVLSFDDWLEEYRRDAWDDAEEAARETYL